MGLHIGIITGTSDWYYYWFFILVLLLVLDTVLLVVLHTVLLLALHTGIITGTSHRYYYWYFILVILPALHSGTSTGTYMCVGGHEIHTPQSIIYNYFNTFGVTMKPRETLYYHPFTCDKCL